MKKIVLTFGLISGLVLSALMAATIPFSDHASVGLIVGYTTMVASFFFVYFGIRQYRDTVGGGRVSFGRGFSVGILIGLIASMCYTATWEVMYFGGKSDFAEKYAAQQITKLKASGKPQAEIDKGIKEAQDWAVRYHNPLYNIGMTMLEPLPPALLIALVSAGVLSRRKKAGLTPAPA